MDAAEENRRRCDITVSHESGRDVVDTRVRQRWGAEVCVLMRHEMENGRRKDEAGNIIPAWFIAGIKAQHNGRTVPESRSGNSISKNPYLIFRYRSGVAGDRIALAWPDKRGDARLDEAAIS